MNKLELSLRDKLAIDRTKLANQRTLLAMLRTGLYLILMAFTIWSLHSLEEIRYLSGFLFTCGLLTMVIGIILWKKQKNLVDNAYLKKSKS